MDEDYGYDAWDRDDDYNVFEENCLDADRAAGEYDDLAGSDAFEDWRDDEGTEFDDMDEADSYAFDNE